MNNLTLLVLAGGYSERFEGKKALYKVKDKTLIQHVVEEASKASKNLVISCKSDLEKLQKIFPKTKIIQDKYTEDGPLVGLLSSLPEIESEYVAVLSCDCPKVKPEVLDLLFEKAQGHSGAVPKWPNGYLEPLVAVYHTRELEEATEEAWKEGKMKLSKAVKLLPDVIFVPVSIIEEVDPELESFINLNTPEGVEEEF